MVFLIQCQAQSLIIMLPLISLITLATDSQIIRPYTHFTFYYLLNQRHYFCVRKIPRIYSVEIYTRR